MMTSTINIPVSIPDGITLEVENLQKKLTAFAMSLIQRECAKTQAKDEPRISKFVQSIGRAVDLSDLQDDKDAYKRHLAQKYA